MEDDLKADQVQSQLKLQGKAGWIKKAVGRVLPSYKERFVHVKKTEIAVYENEDLKNCLERLDLENYEKCHEVKSPFKKKHRLILIHSPNCGNKVPDLKFQTQNAEERDAWIKALADGINRAKNKILDEVKIDESCNLDHVTRSRPKGNRGRRPPTRIHMKEVAGMSSDGILRLDLDMESAVIPTESKVTTLDEVETKNNADEAGEELSKTQEVKSEVKRKVLMPPMPPNKETKPIPIPARDPDGVEDCEQVEVPAPSASAECTSLADNSIKEDGAIEMSPEAIKKLPPIPPAKPTGRSRGDVVDASKPSPTSPPPTPPPTDKKPLQTEGAVKKEVEREAQVAVNNTDEEQVLSDSISEMSMATKDLSPTLTPVEDPSSVASEGECLSLPDSDEIPVQLDVPSVLVTLSEPSLSPLLYHLPGDEKRSEEKSVDSGQHSDSDSEFSLDGDTLAASTSALRGSSAGLDALDISEDNMENYVSIHLAQPPATPKIVSSGQSKGFTALSTSAKMRSASSGDLLFDVTPQTEERTNRGADKDQVMKLETELFDEMKKTGDLLRVSQAVGDGEVVPGDLLAKAMEKLRKADHVLQEVKKLTLVKNRNSW